MMNDFRFYSKDFLLGFIDVYKKLPSLWQVKNPEYHNRDKKNKDYDILIKKMKEIEPRADRNSVANKVSNLRSVYKRECKRLLKEQPDKKPEELVSSNIWYFHYLHFLQDQQKPVPATSEVSTSEKVKTNKISPEQNQEATNTSKRKAEIAADDEPPTKSTKTQSPSPSTNEKSTIKLEEDQSEQPENSNTNNTEFLKENEILLPELILKTEPEETPVEADNDEHESDLASEIGASTYNSDHANSDRANSVRPQNFDLMERNNFDRFDHMTSAWAGILRNLPRSQQIFAEKLINDVMFEAQLESLSRNSGVVVNLHSQKEKQNGFTE